MPSGSPYIQYLALFYRVMKKLDEPWWVFCISWGRHTFNGHTVMIWPGTVRETVTANNWFSLVGYVQPESQKLPGLEGRNWPAIMRCEVKRTLVFRLYLFLRNPKLSKAIPCAFVNLFFDPLALNQLTS